MVDSTNGMSAADVAAVVGNNRNNGDGIFGGEGGYLLLFLVLLMSGGLWGGNGFGGGMGGYGMWNMGMAPYFYNSQTQNEVARGFDNSAVNAALTAISAAVNGIGTQLCNGFAGVNQNVSNGFANAEIAANNRQMAAMQQGFAAQTAISGQLNGIGMNQQSAIYENRQNIADLKYTVAQENCLDRQAVSDGIRDQGEVTAALRSYMGDHVFVNVFGAYALPLLVRPYGKDLDIVDVVVAVVEALGGRNAFIVHGEP